MTEAVLLKYVVVIMLMKHLLTMLKQTDFASDDINLRLPLPWLLLPHDGLVVEGRCVLPRYMSK